MDNVRFHKVAIINNRIIESGHVLKFLPPYSPFLNPIENLFSKWKQLVRSERRRNDVNLFEIIDSSYEQITSMDCEGFYRNMLRFLLACLNRVCIEDENLIT
jgi:transposase